MVKSVVVKKKKLSMSQSAVHMRKYGYAKLTLRFADAEHRELVKSAAAEAKIAINAWLVRVTLEAARRELARASKG
jgi:predicted HicB family RNase H-like nuclease